MAEGRDPLLELGDGAVDRGEVLGGAGRQRAVELGERASRGELARALDHPALELAPQVALELLDALAVEGHRLVVALGAAPLGLEAERAADPLDVDADDARALAAAAECGDREPREVAHLPVLAVADRLADGLAQALEVDLAVEALGLGECALERLGLRGAEEVAVEQQLEDPPVLLRLGDRRRERLAEVLAAGPADLLEGRERVERLRCPDRDSLAAQLLEEGEQPRGGRGH